MSGAGIIRGRMARDKSARSDADQGYRDRQSRAARRSSSAEIAAYALASIGCTVCDAGPGVQCAGEFQPPRTMHQERFVIAVIALKGRKKQARLTARQREILAGIRALPEEVKAQIRADIEAITTERGGLRATREWFEDRTLPWPPIAGWREAITNDSSTRA